MKKSVLALIALSSSLALAACGSSDEASQEAMADTVEMPADDAMAGTPEPVAVETAAPVDASAPAAAAGDAAAVVNQTAEDAGTAAEQAAADAEAAANAAAAAAQ